MTVHDHPQRRTRATRAPVTCMERHHDRMRPLCGAIATTAATTCHHDAPGTPTACPNPLLPRVTPGADQATEEGRRAVHHALRNASPLMNGRLKQPRDLKLVHRPKMNVW